MRCWACMPAWKKTFSSSRRTASKSEFPPNTSWTTELSTQCLNQAGSACYIHLMSIPTPEELDAEIIRELEHFNPTDEMPQILRVGFDQTGKWVGMKRFVDGKNFPEKLIKKIRKLKVPKEVLITTDADGRHLHGSYVVETEQPVEIDFSTINGNLSAKSNTNPDFHAPNLTDVKGTVDIKSFNVDMPNLLYVGNHLILTETKKLNIPRLCCVISSIVCVQIEEFSAPELQVVHGMMLLHDAIDVQVPKLTQTGWHLYAEKATSFVAPNLKFVGGVLCTTSARDFYLPGLKAGKWLMHKDAERIFVRKALKQPTFEL